MKLLTKLLAKITKYSVLLLLFTGMSHYTKIAYERGFYEYYGDAVVKLSVPFGGSGTGFNIKHKDKYYILTNNHICRMSDNDYLYSESSTGVSYVKILHRSKTHDLCLVEGLPRNNYLSIASSYSFREKIFLIGHPRGDALTMEEGRIIQIRNITLIDYDTPIDQCSKEDTRKTLFGAICVRKFKALQSNAISFPGNSGSPVLNKWGNVIGVLFAGRRDTERLSFIVPLEYINELLAEI